MRPDLFFHVTHNRRPNYFIKSKKHIEYFNVKSFPTYIVLSKFNQIILRTNSYQELMNFINQLDVTNLNLELLLDYSKNIIESFGILTKNMLFRRKIIKYTLKNLVIFNKNYNDLDREYFGQRIFLPD